MSDHATPLPFVERPLAGWGNLPVERGRVYRPHRVGDLERLLEHGDSGGLIARGLGRSYGDAALNAGGGVILSEQLARFRGFDETDGILDCEAGTSIDEILRLFVPRGWFVPVTPGTRFVTLGGAIAADVHGKNHHVDGSIASFVVDLTLRTPAGETIVCSASERPEVFEATLGGMGLTGFILSARLRLMPIETAWIKVDTRRARNLEEALDAFEQGDDDYRYSVAWIDCLAGGSALGRSVLMRGDHARPEDLPAARRARPLHEKRGRGFGVPLFAPSWALNPLSVRLFNGLYYARHRDGSKVVPCGPFFHPLDSVRDWNRLYGRRGFVQYQTLLPPETSRAGLQELLRAIGGARAASFLAVLKRFGPSSRGMLSFPAPGHTLALDLPNSGRRLRELLKRLDAIVLEHGGRVYLAKDATTSAEAVARMYPRLEEFRRVRAMLDPAGTLTSSLARRVGLA